MKRKNVTRLLSCILVTSLLFVGVGCGNKVELESEPEPEAVTEEVVSEEVSEESKLNIESERGDLPSSEEVTTEVITTETDIAEEEISEVDNKVENSSEPSLQELSFNVTDISKVMYAQRNVNLRKGPSTDYEKVGSLKTNQEVKVTGQADNGWYRIDYNSNEAFVSNNYLGDSIIVASSEKPSETPTSEPTGRDIGGGVTIIIGDGSAEKVFNSYLETDMLALVNQLRRDNGVPELTWNSTYESYAQNRIEGMARSGKLSHSYPEYKPDAAYGENISMNYSGANGFFQAYCNSEGHKNNLLSANYTSMACATCSTLKDGGGQWNIVFLFID